MVRPPLTSSKVGLQAISLPLPTSLCFDVHQCLPCRSKSMLIQLSITSFPRRNQIIFCLTSGGGTATPTVASPYEIFNIEMFAHTQCTMFQNMNINMFYFRYRLRKNDTWNVVWSSSEVIISWMGCSPAGHGTGSPWQAAGRSNQPEIGIIKRSDFIFHISIFQSAWKWNYQKIIFQGNYQKIFQLSKDHISRKLSHLRLCDHVCLLGRHLGKEEMIHWMVVID